MRGLFAGGLFQPDTPRSAFRPACQVAGLPNIR
jgi:hypothetical protein